MSSTDATVRWTIEELRLAFHLYCQIPFGRLHYRNPEIVELASLIGRTPNALAMKLSNFASLDPAITSTGRKGLTGASRLDREVWAEFHDKWEPLALECARQLEALRSAGKATPGTPHPPEAPEITIDYDYTGETKKVIADRRIKQGFFRRAVLSSYGCKCCISGVTEERLLIASHIVPWSCDKSNRLNPSNGLCLSAIHDRAFDAGLFTLSQELRVVLSASLKSTKDDLLRQVFWPAEGKSISLPDRFAPAEPFLSFHRNEIFDNGGPL